jgi:hypothetical protein
VSVRAGVSAEWAGRWAEGERVAAWEGDAAAGVGWGAVGGGGGSEARGGRGKRPRAWAGFSPARGERVSLFLFIF